MICSVLFFAVDDSYGNKDCIMKGTLPGTHWLLQAGDLQEEERLEGMGSQDPPELIGSHLITIDRYHPGYSNNHLSDLVTTRISGLDPVLLDRPPPHPSILTK